MTVITYVKRMKLIEDYKKEKEKRMFVRNIIFHHLRTTGLLKTKIRYKISLKKINNIDIFFISTANFS